MDFYTPIKLRFGGHSIIRMHMHQLRLLRVSKVDGFTLEECATKRRIARVVVLHFIRYSGDPGYAQKFVSNASGH
jgi:hypothetical protein